MKYPLFSCYASSDYLLENLPHPDRMWNKKLVNKVSQPDQVGRLLDNSPHRVS